MNKETIYSIIFSAKENTDFDFIEKYDEEAKKSEIAGDFTSAIINYKYKICYLTKVYRFAISAHNENSQYQTYNGKHFLETAQKWKNEIIKIHKHILEIAREHKDLFEGLVNIKKYNPEDVLILSYEVLVYDMCRYLKKDKSSKKMVEEFSTLIKQFRIFAIEDIDFLAGKTSTLACICLLINKIVEYQTTIVVITGIDIYDKMPYFVDHLNNLTYIKLS